LQKPIIVWFRRDLRLYDNPALTGAAAHGARILPVYIHAREEEEPWQPGAASHWWLHHSLCALDEALAAAGAGLTVVRGDSLSMLYMLAAKAGAGAVYWNRLYDPATIARDTRVRKALETAGIQARSFPGYLVREPWEVRTGTDSPYKVFTPYSRASFALGDPGPPLAAPLRISGPEIVLAGDGIDALGLLPRIRWDAGLYDYWNPGEAAAWRRIDTFIDEIAAGYDSSRDRPGMDGTSRLSPRLHFGEVSPRALWHAVVHGLGRKGREADARPFLRQLLWRDFAHQLLYHFPGITRDNFKPAFDAYPWCESADDPLVSAWRAGATGIPIVDAGMRELWHTGYMHNRVRMNTASFLTKNAGVHWRLGADWFWDTLVDANLANNTMGWQWVAGSGPDAGPYFRIFNPATQGQRFDPAGEYVRRWIPEIAGLPDKYLQAPWTASTADLADAGIRLGRDYPRPVVDLRNSRARALQAYDRYVKSASG